MDTQSETEKCQTVQTSFQPFINELVEHDYVKYHSSPCESIGGRGESDKTPSTQCCSLEEVPDVSEGFVNLDPGHPSTSDGGICCSALGKEGAVSVVSPSSHSNSDRTYPTLDKYTTGVVRLANVDVSYFNLASEEGQEHLRELNEELKALNEQGSPKLSLLHGLAENLETGERLQSSRIRKQTRKRKQLLETGEKVDNGIHLSNSAETDSCSKKKRKLRSKLEDERSQCTVSRYLDDIEKEKHEVIPESAEDEIERILQEKAWKNNLTTVNVKNILRYVITNEHVLAMVRNTMQAESGEDLDLGTCEAIYEPKLTRSKAKELLEKKAKVPWPISPIKKPSPAKSAKKLIELEFSESDASSDEEYHPQRDDEASEEEHCNSLHDNEPKASQESALSCTTEDEENLEENAVLENLECEDTIALRTRSKLPLNDTPLESIEADFVAPDITTDMYDSECDDEEWKAFLSGFLKPLDSSHGDNMDDDASDPEYNFLEEDDVPDREDLRDDRAVKITKKELHELMAELFEAAEAEFVDAEEDDGSSVPSFLNGNDSDITLHDCERHVLNSTATCAVAEPLFDSNMQQQLEDQMRKHVQLLTQAYLLSANVPDLVAEKNLSKSFLLELRDLVEKSEVLYRRLSSFAAYNLKESIRIVTSYDEKAYGHTTGAQEHKKRINTRKIPAAAMSVIASSKVFIYPDLLPVCGFKPFSGNKLTFVEAEDNLLAMGLEQFMPLKEFSCWKLIKDHMIPVKTAKQIFIRAKNLRSSKWPLNPVKHYYLHKCAPVIQHPIQSFDPDSIIAPINQLVTVLPEWLQNYILENGLHTSEVTNENIRRLPRLLLPAPSVLSVSAITSTATNENPDCDNEIFGSVANTSCSTASAVVTLTNMSQSSDPVVSSCASSCVKGVSDQSASIKLGLSATVSHNSTVSQIPDVNISGLQTPEKPVTGCALSMPVFSPGFGIPRLSPLKQVSPIIKKYRPRQLRKTGGNLHQHHLKLPNLLPKVVVLPQATRAGPRVLAPKMINASVNQKSDDEMEVKVVVSDATKPDHQTEIIPEEIDRQECAAAPEIIVISEINEFTHETPDAIREEEKQQKVCNEKEAQVVSQQGPNKEFVLDAQESESEVDGEMFDDGDDTADDDAVDIPGDNEDDLAALMAASTTIKTTPRHRHQMIKNNKKLKRDKKALLAMLSCDALESDPMKEERETAFAQAYLQKVKEAVGADEHLFEEFLKILHEFSQNDKNVVQLYKDVCTLLKDFPELCEEFVAFLLPEQAYECGKFMEYLTLSKMQIFLRKLEVHFGKHPHHIQKIIKVLAQLQLQENLTIEDVKTALLPLLRGQQHLIEEFLQLFPQEAPAESCMTDFEEVFVPDGNEEIRLDRDGVEAVELPDKQDSYGGEDCICSCHVASEKLKVHNRHRHCIGCGIKFIDGRIFLQSGKLLKPCQVTYLTPLDKEQTKKDIASDSSVNIASPSVTSAGAVSKISAPHAQEPTSPTSMISSSSPSISKESDDEPEIGSSSDDKVASVKDQISKDSPHLELKPSNPLFNALEQISQNNSGTLNLPLPSDAVTEDAILTPDTTTNPSTPIPADFSTLRQVISHEDVANSLEFEIHQNHSDSEDVVVTVTDRTVYLRKSGDSAVHVNVSCNERTSVTDSSTDLPVSVKKSAASCTAEFLNDGAKNQQSLDEQCTVPPHGTSGSTVSHSGDEELTKTVTALGSTSKLQNITPINAENHAVDGSGQVVVLWTRELDRILLQTCQQLGPSSETFAVVASKLSNKTVEQVASRFQALMALFSQQDTNILLNSNGIPKDDIK